MFANSVFTETLENRTTANHKIHECQVLNQPQVLLPAREIRLQEALLEAVSPSSGWIRRGVGKSTGNLQAVLKVVRGPCS
jgi:hypothetical protein